jgi:hypothetical protein
VRITPSTLRIRSSQEYWRHAKTILRPLSPRSTSGVPAYSIKISERMALEAKLLVQDPGKLAQLMNANSRLQATHQHVAKLLKDVAEGDRPKM